MMERLHFGRDTSYSALEASIHVARYALAKSLCSGRAVLDVACGEGYGSFLLADWGADSVLGIDVSEDAVAVARQHFSGPKIDYVAGDVLRLDELVQGRTFDLLVSLETIEHVEDAELFLRKLRAVASPDATIIISCPNDHWYYAEGEGNPFHLRKYRFDEFRKLAEGVLGRATSWRIGSLVVGFGTVRLDTAIAGERQDQSALRNARPIGTALLVPTERSSQPTADTCSFFVGIWGPDIDDVATVTYPVSMEAGRRALLGDDFAADVQQYVQRLDARRGELESTTVQQKDYITRLEGRRDELERILEAQRVELENAQVGPSDVITHLEARRDELERTLAELWDHHCQVKERESELERAQSDNKDIITQFETQRGEMERTQSDQKNVIARLEAKRDELERAESDHRGFITQLEARRDELERAQSDHKDFITQLEARRDELERAQSNHKDFITQLEAQRDELERTQSGHKDFIAQLEAQRDELERTQANYKDFITQLEAQRDEMQRAQWEHKDYIARLEARRDDLEARVRGDELHGPIA